MIYLNSLLLRHGDKAVNISAERLFRFVNEYS